MGKRKAKSLASDVPSTSADYKPSIHVDLDDDDTDQLNGVKIGDKVTVTVQGKVKSIEMRKASSYSSADKITGSLGVEIGGIMVTGGKTVFEEMADDEEQETK